MRFIRFRSEFQAAILDLHDEAMGRFMDVSLPPHETSDLHSIEESYLKGGGEFLVGILNDEVVAMGGFRRCTRFSAELKRMRIRSELQGQGLGSRLLDELERIASRNGINELTLETAKDRPLTLVFYRRHGYVEDGTNTYGAIETLRFKKRLGETGGTVLHE